MMLFCLTSSEQKASHFQPPNLFWGIVQFLLPFPKRKKQNIIAMLKV